MLFVDIMRRCRNYLLWKQFNYLCTLPHPLSRIPGYEGVEDFSDSEEDWSSEENPSDYEDLDEESDISDDDK